MTEDSTFRVAAPSPSPTESSDARHASATKFVDCMEPNAGAWVVWGSYWPFLRSAISGALSDFVTKPRTLMNFVASCVSHRHPPRQANQPRCVGATPSRCSSSARLARPGQPASARAPVSTPATPRLPRRPHSLGSRSPTAALHSPSRATARSQQLCAPLAANRVGACARAAWSEQVLQ